MRNTKNLSLLQRKFILFCEMWLNLILNRAILIFEKSEYALAGKKRKGSIHDGEKKG